MPDPKATPPAPPAPPAEDFRIKLAEQEGARKALEAENTRLQQLIASRERVTVAPPPAPRPAEPDPLDRLAAEDLTLQPEQRRQLMNAAINRRVNDGVEAAKKNLREENAVAIQALRNDTAIQSLLSNHPDVAKDEEGFAAAMTKAQIRANRAGRNVDGPTLVREALDVYRETAPAVPFIEGSSRPDSQPAPGTVPPAGPRKPSWFEKRYGASKNDVLSEEDPDFEAMTKDYAFRKNKNLAAHDVRSGMREVLSQYESERSEEDPSLLRQEI